MGEIYKKIKKFFKYLGVIFLTLVVVISCYYVHSVQEARKYTQEVILPDLESDQWRHPEGIVNTFEISSNDLSERQKEILLKVQDPGFYEHSGIDLSTPGAGLTTVTQAIVKKLYFVNFKPGIAKLKQSLIARFVVHDMISKDDQLTLFVNVVYFGNVDGKPVVGFESAAQEYYHQSIDKLSEDQYISIIAMLIMPKTFHIFDHPERNKERSDRIKALITGEYKAKDLMDLYYGRGGANQ